MSTSRLNNCRWSCAPFLLAAASAFGQADDPKQLTATVRAALEARDPDRAVEALSRLDNVRASQTPDYEFLFLQGVTWQESAVRGKSTDRSQAIERSKQAYFDALKVRPVAPAVFNNLGSLFALTGDDKSADEWYGKAVAAADERQGYYAQNYARTLEKRDPQQALKYAQLALRAAPGNDDVRMYVGALAARTGDGSEFVRLLAESALNGRTRVVTSLALRELAAAETRVAKSQVLGVLAFALARDHVTLSQQPQPELLEGLNRTVGDADTVVGAKQFATVLTNSPPSSGSTLRWWSDEPIRVLDRTRSAVMRELMIALGMQRLQKRPQDAESLFRAAIELGEHGPDPDAFLRLVDLYVNSRQEGRLQELMRRYEAELFSEKGEAYRRNDLNLVFRMHLALGMTYAYMNVWTSNSPFQNAMFQLENAARAAERFNQRAKQTGKPDRLVMPPEAALKLSDAYATRGQRDRATQLRIDSADALAGARRTAESAEVLQTINKDDVARLAASSRERYRALDASLPKN